jgi:hypothetical protein
MFPSIAEFFSWSGPGVKTHRTWIISPDIQTLESRWKTLQGENDPKKKETLFHPDLAKVRLARGTSARQSLMNWDPFRRHK